MQRRGQIPVSSDRAFSNDDLLATMSEELQSWLAPRIMSEREEFFVRKYDYTTVAGQTEYRVPPRAMGGAVRQVLLGSTAQNLIPVNRIEPKQLYGAQYGYSMAGNAFGGNGGYVFRDTVIQFPQDPSSAGSLLRIHIFQRPNSIVAEQYVSTITAINPATNTVTVDQIPVAFSNTTPFDIVRGTPFFETLAIDQTATISGLTITFANALPSGVSPYVPSVGDFVCLAGQSPVANIPVEMQPVLTQRLVVKVLEATGDRAGMQAADVACEKAWQNALNFSPRDQGSARFATNWNGPGWGGKRWYYNGRF